MSIVSNFIEQFSSFRVPGQRRDLQIRALRIRGIRSLLTFIIAITSVVFLFSFIVSAFKPKNNLQQELVKGDSLVFDKPTFIGHSASGGRIIVTATEATRSLQSDQGEVVLKNPVVTTQTGSKLTAKSGAWNQLKQKLLLHDSVSLRDKNGNVATADYAYWGILENSQNVNSSATEKLYFSGNVAFVQASGANIRAASSVWDEDTSKLLFYSKPISQISNQNSIEKQVEGNITGGNFRAGVLEIDAKNKIAYGSQNVALVTPSISASANTFEFHFDSKHLILRGNARASYSSN